MPESVPVLSAPKPVAPAPIVEHREVLRSAIVGVEDALAQPSFGRIGRWRGAAADAVRTLEVAFTGHMHLTEAPDGLYDEIQQIAPRLESRVTRLRTDHVEIEGALTSFLDSLDGGASQVGSLDQERVDEWRAEGTRVLGLLVRHRQRGIDLTYEAYGMDLGGE